MTAKLPYEPPAHRVPGSIGKISVVGYPLTNTRDSRPMICAGVQ